MKTRIVILFVCLMCSVGALVALGYSGEMPAVATGTQGAAEGAASSLPGWTETGYALDAG
jgi:hypothetical protein